MKRQELTEEHWNKVKDLLPTEKPAHGEKPGKDNRVMLNGILYWLNTGIPWRDLPERYALGKVCTPGFAGGACKVFGSIF